MTKWEHYQRKIDETAQIGAKVLAACNNKKGRKIMYDNFVSTINTYRSLQSKLSYEDAIKEWHGYDEDDTEPEENMFYVIHNYDLDKYYLQINENGTIGWVDNPNGANKFNVSGTASLEAATNVLETLRAKGSFVELIQVTLKVMG